VVVSLTAFIRGFDCVVYGYGKIDLMGVHDIGIFLMLCSFLSALGYALSLMTLALPVTPLSVCYVIKN